ERAYGRAGDAVALGVVLAAVARAAVTGRDDRVERDAAVRRVLGHLRLAGVLRAARAVRLHRAAEVDAVVGDDREARDLFRRLVGIGDRAVVADEGRPAGDLSLGGVDDE